MYDHMLNPRSSTKSLNPGVVLGTLTRLPKDQQAVHGAVDGSLQHEVSAPTWTPTPVVADRSDVWSPGSGSSLAFRPGLQSWLRHLHSEQVTAPSPTFSPFRLRLPALLELPASACFEILIFDSENVSTGMGPCTYMHFHWQP